LSVQPFVEEDQQEKKIMSAVTEMQTLPEQEEKAAVIRKAAAKENYVRLRLHVKNGQISVAGARTVEGPLVMPSKLHSGLAYEVTCGKKRIGLGSIEDSAVRRGFPHPESAPAGQEGHSVVEQQEFEFTVRIQQKEFSPWALPRISVSVYRVKGETPDSPVMPEMLSTQFSRELREVAKLKGIHLKKLSRKLQKEITRALR
jgi:hypothetical protein